MSYEIVENIWENLRKYTGNNNLLFVVDENIYKLYEKNIKELSGKNNICLVRSGEENKNFHTLKNIYKVLIEGNIDRDGLIISIGGGVVGDIAGFAAATYKRGIDYIQVPTSLLAQVDSGVGGKTAIDYLGYKNIIGAFHFPLKTYVDINFISSLSKDEITCGLGEIIKYGLIEDYDLFIFIKENIEKVYERDKESLSFLVEKSLDIKSSIVKKDKLDLGIRQKLNFGHTIGHSIESYFDYKKYNHGEAVILGMIYESHIAYKRGQIEREYYDEIVGLLRPLVDFARYKDEEVDILLEYMKNDKKNKEGRAVFILPIDKGQVDIFYDVDEEDIRRSIVNNY